MYKGELFTNLSGNIKKGTTTLDNIDLILNSDLGKSIGLNNTNIFVQFLGNSGGAPNDFVGTIQGISNIEAYSTWKLYQLFIEKRLFDDKFSVLTGLYDLNSEFDVDDNSGLFINPSFGIGPDFSQSGINGPSIFPTTSLAVRLKYENENIFAKIAVFDGVSGDPDKPEGTQIKLAKDDGLLIVGEVGYEELPDDLMNLKISLGGWTYTKNCETTELSVDYLPKGLFEKNYGFYLILQKLLNSELNTFGFLRFGYANKKINPIDFSLESGIKLDGMFTEQSEFGLAVAIVHLSADYMKNMEVLENLKLKKYEMILELSYSFNLTNWIKIQPDFQYIINPTYSYSTKNTLVFFTRMELIL